MGRIAAELRLLDLFWSEQLPAEAQRSLVEKKQLRQSPHGDGSTICAWLPGRTHRHHVLAGNPSRSSAVRLACGGFGGVQCLRDALVAPLLRAGALGELR
jgi:hypothetical protein